MASALQSNSETDLGGVGDKFEGEISGALPDVFEEIGDIPLKRDGGTEIENPSTSLTLLAFGFSLLKANEAAIEGIPKIYTVSFAVDSISGGKDCDGEETRTVFLPSGSILMTLDTNMSLLGFTAGGATYCNLEMSLSESKALAIRGRTFDGRPVSIKADQVYLPLTLRNEDFSIGNGGGMTVHTNFDSRDWLEGLGIDEIEGEQVLISENSHPELLAEILRRIRSTITVRTEVTDLGGIPDGLDPSRDGGLY